MNVYLFYIVGKRRPVFHAEHPEDTTPRDARGRPVRSRLERWWRGLLATLKRTVRRGGPRLQRLWGWLNRRPPPDEPLLKRLRDARQVTIYHPTTLEAHEARRLWRRYLARRWRSHLVTLAWDLALSPLIALLMVVPGPNVIGYWFVYRIATHLLAMRGVLWARLGWTPFAFHPEAALDRPLLLHDGRQVARVAAQLSLDDLDDFLRRLVAYRRGPGEPTRMWQGREQAHAETRLGVHVPRRNDRPVRPAASPDGDHEPDEPADSIF